MSDLPLDKKDYNYAVLITDFISKIKIYNADNGNKNEFKFIPKLKGYEIIWSDSGDDYEIIINISNFFRCLTVKKLKNGKSVFKQFYRSRSVNDNDYIVDKILN